MNSILEQFIRKGTIPLPTGKNYRVKDGIRPEEGYFLQQLINAVKPKNAVEVGLASGISTLFILDAMSKIGGNKLIGIDPSQYTSHKDKYILNPGNLYHGRGLCVIKKSRFSCNYEFHNDTSQKILPKLVDKRVKIGFAFIDGWHTFDHALVDFFYVDQLLEIGGIVALHDTRYSQAVKTLCDFIGTNREYQKIKIPKQCNTGNIMAFKKLSNDTRSWDHFIPFWEPIGLTATLHSIPRLIKNAIYRKIRTL